MDKEINEWTDTVYEQTSKRMSDCGSKTSRLRLFYATTG